MGSFYANISLRVSDPEAIADILRQQGRTAFVLPPNKGYVVICDAECDDQDIEVISSLAKSLSTQLACPAFATLNHDDDLLWFQVMVNGAVMDEYNSAPDLLDADAPHQPIGGNALLLSTIFSRPGKASAIDKILHKNNYILENERHVALARVLGLPSEYAPLGYRELKTADEATDENSDPVTTLNKAWLRRLLRPDRIVKQSDLTKEVRKLVRQDKKISAIDLYRRHTGCTLQEARDYIESL